MDRKHLDLFQKVGGTNSGKESMGRLLSILHHPPLRRNLVTHGATSTELGQLYNGCFGRSFSLWKLPFMTGKSLVPLLYSWLHIPAQWSLNFQQFHTIRPFSQPCWWLNPFLGVNPSFSDPHGPGAVVQNHPGGVRQDAFEGHRGRGRCWVSLGLVVDSCWRDITAKQVVVQACKIRI